MKQCIKVAKKVASSDYTILIRGDSGTGKELLAQSIHNYSTRKNYPFVAVNCAAIPENLLESELFGYEEGSFTGAKKSGKIGLFEHAHHGTIFLDEIGDISPSLQTRLLRVIQEKQIMRVGSDKLINIDARIIAATNADLEQRVNDGRFRSRFVLQAQCHRSQHSSPQGQARRHPSSVESISRQAVRQPAAG